MKLLFEMDLNDYEGCTEVYERHSARSIIIQDRKVAMVHSLKYDFYKFPGGGIEAGESPVNAMIRETLEESGLEVITASIREYGYVHRIQRSDDNPAVCFVQDNFYYLCDAEQNICAQQLDAYEQEEGYQLVWAEPEVAIEKNRTVKESPYHPIMFEREAKVLELLMKEGYFR